MVDYLKSKILDTNWVTKTFFMRVTKSSYFYADSNDTHISSFNGKYHRNGRINKTKLNFCKDENEVDFYKYGY